MPEKKLEEIKKIAQRIKKEHIFEIEKVTKSTSTWHREVEDSRTKPEDD